MDKSINARWAVWTLADDPKTYGDKAGKCIVTTEDGETEICGVCLDEDTAKHIVTAHNSKLKKAKRYVVRVVHKDDRFGVGQLDAPFLECLRYASLVTVHENVFDILPPSGVDTRVWADQNAARMESFGYNAVCAPVVYGALTVSVRMGDGEVYIP